MNIRSARFALTRPEKEAVPRSHCGPEGQLCRRVYLRNGRRARGGPRISDQTKARASSSRGREKGAARSSRGAFAAAAVLEAAFEAGANVSCQKALPSGFHAGSGCGPSPLSGSSGADGRPGRTGAGYGKGISECGSASGSQSTGLGRAGPAGIGLASSSSKITGPAAGRRGGSRGKRGGPPKSGMRSPGAKGPSIRPLGRPAGKPPPGR